MAPTPKRKHSKQRKGKRRTARKIDLLGAIGLVYDKKTGRPRLSHRKIKV